MDTKFVIFVLISTFLIAAIYSSTATHYVWAKISRSCAGGKTADGKFAITTCCTIETDDKTGAVTNTICSVTTCPIGQMDKCHTQEKTGAPTTKLPQGGDLPPLTNEENKKAPKIPNDLGILNDSGG